MADISSLNAFFNPASVAVIGASSDPSKAGHTALQNLLSMGYRGKVYPVNPREESILGLRCYRSLLDIPEPVELCVLLVAAGLTLRVAGEIAERKRRHGDVAAAVCMSAGFGELNTPEAKEMERTMVETLKSSSVRLIGPNCVGITDAHSGLNTNFDIPAYPRGGLSIVTQSGALGNSVLFWRKSMEFVGLCKFASVGNMVDVDMTELLAFLKEDPSTTVIGVYIEGLPAPAAFFETAREVSAVKPVVVFKSGKSEVGTTAALSHTGAVAGSDAIYDGAFRQAGLIRARSISEFYDTLRVFERLAMPRGNRVCVLSQMGGPGTICIDQISEIPELRMASFSPETVRALREICVPMANIGRPDGYVDVTAASDSEMHGKALDILFRDPGIDMVLHLVAPTSFMDQGKLVAETIRAWRSQPGERKPLLNGVTYGSFVPEIYRELESAGLPAMEFPDSLARIAGNMARYRDIREKAPAVLRSRREAGASVGKGPSPVAGLLGEAVRKGRRSLTEPEGYEVCRAYGISAPPYGIADTYEGAREAANRVGYPVALKAVSEEILHKTDAGGVILRIDSDAKLEESCRRLLENVRLAAPHAAAPRFLVQKMVSANCELVLGALRDRLFGPVVMFGLGGIFIEAIKCVGFRLAPLSMEDAIDLVRATLPPAILRGARGGQPVHVDAIAEAAVRLSRMIVENEEIEQVDLNPLLPQPDGYMAVDARVILKE